MIKSNKEKIEKKVLYAKAVFGKEEKKAVLKSLENEWLASGPLVKKFENKIAKLFDVEYAVAVNSGSSANLLALRALVMRKGAEIITPACTFATTVSEIINSGFVPVFVDSVLGRYTIDEDLIEEAITNRTSAILVPQLIGGVCDMERIKDIADKHELHLIDDSCDTIAPTFKGYTVANYADITTTSFYGSHIITACGVGGMVLTDYWDLKEKVVSLRDWGRVGDDKEAFKERFDFEVDGIPYDKKFLYNEFGYNLKMNEASAAFGLEQLKKLPKFLKIRKENFRTLYKFFLQYQDLFELPRLIKGATTNWLAFPLTIMEGALFTRYDLLEHLEKKGIQTRVLFSGNITRHPIYKKNNLKWRGAKSFPVADYIMANSFLIGCHHAMRKKETDYIISSFEEFLK